MQNFDDKDYFTRKEVLDIIWTKISDVPHYGKFINSSHARDTLTDFINDQLTEYRNNYYA